MSGWMVGTGILLRYVGDRLRRARHENRLGASLTFEHLKVSIIQICKNLTFGGFCIFRDFFTHLGPKFPDGTDCPFPWLVWCVFRRPFAQRHGWHWPGTSSHTIHGTIHDGSMGRRVYLVEWLIFMGSSCRICRKIYYQSHGYRCILWGMVCSPTWMVDVWWEMYVGKYTYNRPMDPICFP